MRSEISTTAGNFKNGSGKRYVAKYGLATGINETDVSNAVVSVCPNPTTKYSTIRLSNVSKNPFNLNLYDTKGQLVRTICNIYTDEIRISRGDLSGGLYYFLLSTDEKAIGNGKLIFE
jgi:hypothetical protein